MKKTLLLVTLLTSLFYCSRAQSIVPSTVRQVFALEKGDSLMYHASESFFYQLNGCNTLCNAYWLKVVDSTYYVSAPDTLIILFHSYFLGGDTATNSSSCGLCRSKFWVPDYFPLDTDRWTVTDLDSTPVAMIRHSYGGSLIWVSDTVYRGLSDYNSSQQNHCYVTSGNMESWDETYADSLGPVYKGEDPGIYPVRKEQLIYYHKANGKKWGEENPHTAINEVKEETAITIYPNPASHKFTISTEQYQNTTFELHDILGKKVMAQPLHSKDTEVNTNHLPAGIYLWHITDGNESIKQGKLIIE